MEEAIQRAERDWDVEPTQVMIAGSVKKDLNEKQSILAISTLKGNEK